MSILFEEFFYLRERKNLPINIIENYNTNYNNNGPYEGQMRCPECHLAELRFTPSTSSRRAFLSAIDLDKHADGCSYKYERASSKAIQKYFEDLTNQQVKDKLVSMLRMMNRKKEAQGYPRNPQSQDPDSNPFICSDKDQKKYYRKALPRRSLNRPLVVEDANLLCAFYGQSVYLSVDTVHKESPDKTPYVYHRLKIKTNNNMMYSIYRGVHYDDVEDGKIYNIVFIGSFDKSKLKYFEKNIDLIKDGNFFNQFALAIEEVANQ
ncbi:MAG: hypothetical protein Q4A84_10795 [Neisseria sp.]|uniref:hypothetical protein n=1 Tax=Neisseria sp. TaxID=192066 RepID=UPI0026DBA217|nr:hypothetical protein [Neisseria sp.]MDO4642166.1 hypothetical protein [Neisseria sp.]